MDRIGYLCYIIYPSGKWIYEPSCFRKGVGLECKTTIGFAGNKCPFYGERISRLNAWILAFLEPINFFLLFLLRGNLNKNTTEILTAWRIFSMLFPLVLCSFPKKVTIGKKLKENTKNAKNMIRGWLIERGLENKYGLCPCLRLWFGPLCAHAPCMFTSSSALKGLPIRST